MSISIHEKIDHLSIGAAAKYLGISVSTLRRWSRTGKIIYQRSPGGHRYYLRSQLDNLYKKDLQETTKINIKKHETNHYINKDKKKIRPIFIFLLVTFLIFDFVVIVIYILQK